VVAKPRPKPEEKESAEQKFFGKIIEESEYAAGHKKFQKANAVSGIISVKDILRAQVEDKGKENERTRYDKSARCVRIDRKPPPISGKFFLKKKNDHSHGHEHEKHKRDKREYDSSERKRNVLVKIRKRKKNGRGSAQEKNQTNESKRVVQDAG